MKEKALYYAKNEFYEIIRKLGGSWTDTKKRPIVCIIESSEHVGLYWAIPMGKLNHRDTKGIERINKYLSYPDYDIRSCYYHIGRTTNKSIFFISDAVPITEKYIDEEHVGADNKPFIIKNIGLAYELERKLIRILAIENAKKNSFRQRITDIKNFLVSELEAEKFNEEVALTNEQNHDE